MEPIVALALLMLVALVLIIALPTRAKGQNHSIRVVPGNASEDAAGSDASKRLRR